jgi:hypothetical protein
MTERRHFVQEHDLALPHQRRLTQAEIAAYWQRNAERWQRLRRIEHDEPAPRPAVILPDMREGNERLQRKRRKHGATD